MADARVAGLLLAAGRGRRFAAIAARDKLLEPVDGTPVARRACRALAAGCDPVFAVVGPHASAALCEALQAAGARLVVADDADRGMGHSLAAGVRAAAATGLADVLMVMPADMPWVQDDTVRAVARAAREGGPEGIVVPTLADGRRGHPVAFGAVHFAALAGLQGDRGARTLLDTLALSPVTVADRGILRDVDSPSDLSSP
jgi:molybdenum cofactor cytidylyltransferase